MINVEDRMSTSNDRVPPASESLIHGVEHFAIATTNPQRLAHWYVQHLNFAALLDTGATVYIKSPNSVVLEFVKADSVPPKPGFRDAGLRHIALAVADLEAVHRQLKSTGVEFESAPVFLPGLQLFFFRDLEGNYLHLVQRERPLL
jgi:glyoxylase I family protein